MFLINNQHYIDLEPYVDMVQLSKIEKDIIYGIVKSKQSFIDSGANYSNFHDISQPSLLDETWPQKLKDPLNPNFEYYKKLNFNLQDCRMFARYAGKYRQMGQTISLRSYRKDSDVNLKASHAGNEDTGIYQHFPTLKEWINNLKIFDEIGRIIFWFNSPNEPHAIHKDQFIGHPDHFVLINLNLERKDLFILDDEGNKHNVNSRVFVFDGRNYHGTQGKDWYSWTIRIDGIFNQTLAESIGIWDHFNPNKQHEQLPNKSNVFNQ